MEEVLIVNDSIVPHEVLSVIPPCRCCGAWVWFTGVVREEDQGQAVSGLTYESYEAMAEKELKTILREARQKWPVHHLLVVHRLGALKVGEVSLLVGVSAPHREAAFAAVTSVIDQLKARVPIWKKESYAMGESQWLS